MWFKNSDMRKSMEVRMYETDGFSKMECFDSTLSLSAHVLSVVVHVAGCQYC